MLLPAEARARQFDMLSLVPLIASLVPLLITPGTLAYFDITPKIALLLLGTALMLLQVHTNACNVRALVSSSCGKWLVGLLAAEWISFAIASLFSANRPLSLGGGSWRCLGLIPETGILLFVLLAAGWLAVDKDRVRALLRAVASSGALAACYGIAQYFGRDPLLPARAYQAGEGVFTIVRPPGTLGHADYFAAWLVVVLFLALALGRLEEKRIYRAAAIAIAGLAAVAIILSGTRAAMLGACVGGAVLVFARREPVRIRGAVIGLVSTAGVILFLFSPAGLKLRARVHWSIEDARGGARLLLWRDSLQMSAHRPLVGFGPETFATEFPRFESIQLASAYPDFYHESPHNIFLDVLTSQGVLGLLALAGLCVLGVWAAVQACRCGIVFAPALAAAFVGLLVAQQFIVFVFTTALYFHLLVALLVVTAWTWPKPARSLPAWLPIPVSLVMFIFVAYCAQLVTADRALALTWRRIASGDIAGASTSYRTVLRWQPPGAAPDLSYSRAMQQAATSAPIFATRLLARQQALEAGVRAVRNAEDRQNAWYNLAMLFAEQNDAAGAERSLRNAILWAPHWFKPHWALARLLNLSGHGGEAMEEARIAVECDGGRDQEVAETWKQLQGSSR
jgi:putative inorganic carbon (hco3(-)) transporter